MSILPSIDEQLRDRYRKSYVISDDGKTITCLTCNRTSYNINDVKNKYCGNCHMFHEGI